jgi:hypothetical protein
MVAAEQALLVTYTCVLLIKSCNLSSTVCSTFGFGDSAEGESYFEYMVHLAGVRPFSSQRSHLSGVFQFFIIFALGMILILVIVTGVRLYYAGYAPKLILVANAHSVPVSQIILRVGRRRYRGLYGGFNHHTTSTPPSLSSVWEVHRPDSLNTRFLLVCACCAGFLHSSADSPAHFVWRPFV